MVRIFSFAAVAVLFASSAAAAATGRGKCGTTLTLPSELESKAAEVVKTHKLKIASMPSGSRAASRSVPVNWHVIDDGSKGKLTSAQIAEQLRVLNLSYSNASMPFTFTLAKTTRTTNSDWFYNAFGGTSQESAMKSALRSGGAGTLNLYSVDLSAQGLLG
jgi:hypothetical protein